MFYLNNRYRSLLSLPLKLSLNDRVNVFRIPEWILSKMFRFFYLTLICLRHDHFPFWYFFSSHLTTFSLTPSRFLAGDHKKCAILDISSTVSPRQKFYVTCETRGRGEGSLCLISRDGCELGKAVCFCYKWMLGIVLCEVLQILTAVHRELMDVTYATPKAFFFCLVLVSFFLLFLCCCYFLFPMPRVRGNFIFFVWQGILFWIAEYLFR